MVSKALKDLENILPYHEQSAMNLGIDLDNLSEYEKQISPVTLATDVRELYQWHNGSETDFFPDFPLFGFKFYSLQEAVEQYRRLDQIQLGLNQYLPIGEVDGGLVLASVLEHQNQSTAIYQYSFDGGDICLLHTNIEAMINVALEIWSNKSPINFDQVRLKYSPEAKSDLLES